MCGFPFRYLKEIISIGKQAVMSSFQPKIRPWAWETS